MTGSRHSREIGDFLGSGQKLQTVFAQFPRDDLQRTADLLDRISAGIVDHTADPEELCLKCGIYFREKCLIRQIVKRNCFYRQQETQADAPLHSSGGNREE